MRVADGLSIGELLLGVSIMTTDADTPITGSDYTSAKGGLYGGYFDSSGLESNVRATVMDERWVKSSGDPATTITYAFPTSTADYLVVPNYPEFALLLTFSPLTQNQKNAALAGFGLVTWYTGVTFTLAASGLA